MILIAVLLMLLCGQHAQAATDLSTFAYDQHPGAQLPLTVPFKDAFGHDMTLGQALAHRPAILALGYFHCPNLCGLVRDDLMNALSNLGEPTNYSLVVLSIDPSRDAGRRPLRPAGRCGPLRAGHGRAVSDRVRGGSPVRHRRGRLPGAD